MRPLRPPVANTRACAATGQCFPAPGAVCQAYSIGCACDGTEINVACTGLPAGYASSPLLHTGPCTGDDAGIAKDSGTDSGRFHTPRCSTDADADAAIAEFQKSLSYEPTKPNTLFNLGIVDWQGKMDIDKATATWQKLLDTNPNYEAKDKVLELMAQAKKHSGVKPGTPAKPLQ